MPRKPRHIIEPAIQVQGIGYSEAIGDFVEVELSFIPADGHGRVVVVSISPERARELAAQLNRDIGTG